MRTFFALVGSGLIIAAACGGALAWDGSAYLFQLLDQQAPFTPNSRLINIPLQLPVLWLSHWTSSVGILQFAFGAVYAAIPLVALVLSWWIVRRDARSLFVWPALAIGLAMLPGQFFFVSEANIAVQLFWPIALAILVRMRRWHIPVVLLLSIAIFFSHPFAIGLFALAAVLALVVGIRYPQDRPKMWLFAGLFALVTAAAVLHFLSVRTTYESDQLNLAILGWTYSVSMAGIPIKVLVAALVAAVILLGVPLLKNRFPSSLVLPLYALEFVCFALAGALLAYWALNANLWEWGGRFTFWAPFISAIFVGIAAVESWLPSPILKQEDGPDWRHRVRAAQLVSLLFVAVLSLQSFVWLDLNNRLVQTLSSSPWSCVSAAPVGWISQTALNHFATPQHSILLQGQTPAKVVLSGDECNSQSFKQGVWLDTYAERSWSRGWFNLQALGTRLQAESEGVDGCSFALTSGWHQTESNGKYWWRWSDGVDARIRVSVDRDTMVTVKGALESYERPNTVDVLLNQTRVTGLYVDWYGMHSFQPFQVALHAGDNEIRLVSHNPPEVYDGRGLAINVGGVSVTRDDGGSACLFHP